MREMQVFLDERSGDGKRRAVEIVDDAREEQQADDEPPLTF